MNMAQLGNGLARFVVALSVVGDVVEVAENADTRMVDLVGQRDGFSDTVDKIALGSIQRLNRDGNPKLRGNRATAFEKCEQLTVGCFRRPAVRDTPRSAAAENDNLSAKSCRTLKCCIQVENLPEIVGIRTDDSQVTRQKQIKRLRLELGMRKY